MTVEKLRQAIRNLPTNAEERTMVDLYYATDNGAEHLESYPTLADALHDIRQMWNDETGPQLFYVKGEDGTYLATMMRDENDSEVCHTLYADGTSESYWCHYVTDEDGWYLWTEVALLEEYRTTDAA